jgi:hypothetical protein
MQTSQGCGTRHLHLWTPVLPSHKVFGSFSMQDAWASKLQSQVALPTTEAEYIAMSQALRDVIPIMGLLQEMREQDFKVLCTKLYMYCKVFEDNLGTLKLARLPNHCPRTKHINVCYHHFANMSGWGLSKYSPLTPRIRLLMLLPSPWHKMIFNVIVAYVQQVTSTSYQSKGVLHYEKLWYFFYRYLRVSPGTMQKCMLHDFVRY